MSIKTKMNNVYDCLKNYVSTCDNEQKKLVDIFFAMCNKVNNNRLEISIGKKVSKGCFQSYLKSISNKYEIGFSQCNNEPQLIIYDQTIRRYCNMVLNLLLINNLKIEERIENGKIYGYYIDFSYDNKIDYSINIVK